MLRFHRLRVVEVRPEAEDAVAVALEVPAGLRGEYCGSPGQHIVLRVTDGEGELRRTYSLTDAPRSDRLHILVRKQPQGRMSQWLAGLSCGTPIEVLPPNGSFTPHAGSLDHGLRVAFAAGSGITPVLSVTRAVLAAGGAMMIFYGNRTSARAMGLETLQGLKDRYPERLSLHFIMSREPQEVGLYNGRLDGAKVRALAGAFFEPRRILEAFICGPGDMGGQARSALQALGMPAERIHVEHFAVTSAALAEADSPAAELAPRAGMAEVGVTLDGRRRSFPMALDADTVLDAAERAGIELPFSCRSGVCSTCRTKVVRGKVRMEHNYALEAWELEQGYVLACQSRCLTPQLELDYDER
ncbi:MAG: 2Fe-2S iron-sulfur cluster-binding protein [Steroidobacteraceae bacterium]